MKTLVVVLLAALASASPLAKFPYKELASRDGWFVPQLDGTLQWVSVEEANLKIKKASMESRGSYDVNFYLYTKSNPTTPQQISVDSVEGLSKSNFNKTLPTKIIIHGWQNNYLSEVNVLLRSALLAGGDFNVICVDWGKYAETIDYIYSVWHVPGVGKQVAALVDFLNQHGDLSFDNLKVMGHSLGAHVSGFTGKYVTRGKINAIIGMDPAYPLYSYNKCSERLCETDAHYVESIQTDGGRLGFLQPIGKAAFYPNGGRFQPGCGLDLFGICAHSRSYQYYAEAIRRNDFMSLKCSDYEMAVDNECGSTYSINVKLGAPTNEKLADGSYYTPVHKKSPFAMD